MPRKRNLKITVIIISLLIITSIIGLVYYSLDKEEEKTKIDIVKLDSVTGQIISPISFKPIGGIDLTLGDVSIKTAQSGFFRFNELDENPSIRINHPELMRSLRKKVTGKRMDIYFDINLFNELILIIDHEARSQYQEIYNLLNDKVRERLSEDDFRNNYNVAYSEEDINDQEIIIDRIKIHDNWYTNNDLNFPKIIEISVENDGKWKNYYFVKENNTWNQVVK